MSYVRRTRMSVLIAGVIGLIVISYRLGKSFASGIPTQTPLVYTGTLQFNGAPVSGTHSIALSLWNDFSSTSSTNQVCSNPVPASPAFDSAGRFQIPLDASCLAAVSANPDLYVQLIIDGTNVLPRSKLNAVPYAVEANHAVAADVASNAAGNLQTQLQALARPVYAPTDGGASISLGAVFQTVTTGTYNGQGVGGYAGAKAKCVAQLNSPTAHMCSAEEVLRSAQLGVAGLVQDPAGTFTSLGWYSSASSSTIPSGSSTGTLYDCEGWASNGSGAYGPIWRLSPQGSYPLISTCDAVNAILCCD